jgi:hypothetical protein
MISEAADSGRGGTMSNSTQEYLSQTTEFATAGLGVEEAIRVTADAVTGVTLLPARSPTYLAEPDAGTSHPGMIDVVHGIGRNPDLLPFYVRAGLLSLDKVLAFINQTGLSTDLLQTRGDVRESYPYMLGPDWLVRFVGYFMGFTSKSAETESTWIPVSEVHCPTLQGCSTEFSFYSTRKDKAVFKVTALGSSGGGGHSHTLTRVSSGSIDAASTQLQAKAELRLRLFENDHGDRFYALDVVRIFDETRYVGIDVSEFYTIPIDTVLTDPNLRAVAADGSLKDLAEELTIETGSSHEFSWGTTVGKLLGGVNAVLTIESEIVSGAQLKYKLLPGHRYVFYRVQPNSHVYLVLHE